MNNSLTRIPVSGDKLADLCINGLKCAVSLFGLYTLLKLSKNGVNDIKFVHGDKEITISGRKNVIEVGKEWIQRFDFMNEP